MKIGNEVPRSVNWMFAIKIGENIEVWKFISEIKKPSIKTEIIKNIETNSLLKKL